MNTTSAISVTYDFQKGEAMNREEPEPQPAPEPEPEPEPKPEGE